MTDLQQVAREAAIGASSGLAVGDLIERIDESEPGVTTFLFESKLKGYVGWRWSVSLFSAEQNVTVSEVDLVAGPGSILAPKWIPWAERLADYKALQAALEEQAAQEAEDASSQETGDESELELETPAEETVEGSEASGDGESFEDAPESAATLDKEEAENSQENADDAGENPPGFFRIFKRGKKRK